MVETQAAARVAGRARLYVVALGILAAVVALDQATKTWALHHLRDDTVHVLGTLRLNLTFNPGVAFGLGGGSTSTIVLVGVVVLVLLAALGRAGVRTTVQAVAVGLVLGGAVGNMTDRLVRHHGGAVIDFIDLQWWPVFNVADAAITTGAILLIVAGFVRSDIR
jgi:signal peptidase II